MIDPFVLSTLATQVYYLKYPGRIRDKIEWAVVTKIKPREIVQVHNNIEVAHQEDLMNIHDIPTGDVEVLGPLIDENSELEEVSQSTDNSISDELQDESSISSSSSSTD